jgi:glutaconyl-CoA/methylmalonyl-CoA decarboxylase subunit delta
MGNMYSFHNIFISAGLSSNLTKALLDTVLGMGIVFVVLILISFLISLFKYIPNLLDKSNKDRDLKDAETTVAEPIIQKDDIAKEELNNLASDNLANDENPELVAVITAAIMSSMGSEAPEDGLFIRSIRRKSKY